MSNSTHPIAVLAIDDDLGDLEILGRSLDQIADLDIRLRAFHIPTEGLEELDRSHFDIVFLDPPYAQSQRTDKGSLFERFLGRIAEATENRPLIVFHHPKKVEIGLDSTCAWHAVEQRIFGTNAVTFLTRI